LKGLFSELSISNLANLIGKAILLPRARVWLVLTAAVSVGSWNMLDPKDIQSIYIATNTVVYHFQKWPSLHTNHIHDLLKYTVISISTSILGTLCRCWLFFFQFFQLGKTVFMKMLYLSSGHLVIAFSFSSVLSTACLVSDGHLVFQQQQQLDSQRYLATQIITHGWRP